VARLNTPQRLGWSLFTLKNRSLFAQSLSAQIYCGLLIAIACLTLSSCHSADYYYYKFPQYTFANRPVPPSKLAQRVMIAYTVNGSSTSTTNAIGNIAIVDAKRDIRSNIENTVATFQIAGYNAGYPSMIFNFPAEVHGYVYSNTDGSLATIDYSKENVAQRVLELTDGKKVPVVYDGVGKDTWLTSLDSVAPRGLVVSFGNASGAVDGVNLGILAAKGSLYVTRPTLATYANNPANLQVMADDLFSMIKSGKVRIDINQRYSLADAAKAQTELSGRRTTGSTILLP